MSFLPVFTFWNPFVGFWFTSWFDELICHRWVSTDIAHTFCPSAPPFFPDFGYLWFTSFQSVSTRSFLFSSSLNSTLHFQYFSLSLSLSFDPRFVSPSLTSCLVVSFSSVSIFKREPSSSVVDRISSFSCCQKIVWMTSFENSLPTHSHTPPVVIYFIFFSKILLVTPVVIRPKKRGQFYPNQKEKWLTHVTVPSDADIKSILTMHVPLAFCPPFEYLYPRLVSIRQLGPPSLLHHTCAWALPPTHFLLKSVEGVSMNALAMIDLSTGTFLCFHFVEFDLCSFHSKGTAKIPSPFVRSERFIGFKKHLRDWNHPTHLPVGEVDQYYLSN